MGSTFLWSYSKTIKSCSCYCYRLWTGQTYSSYLNKEIKSKDLCSTASICVFFLKTYSCCNIPSSLERTYKSLQNTLKPRFHNALYCVQHCKRCCMRLASCLIHLATCPNTHCKMQVGTQQHGCLSNERQGWGTMLPVAYLRLRFHLVLYILLSSTNH